MKPEDQAHAFWNTHNHEQCTIYLLQKVFDLEDKLGKVKTELHHIKTKDE